MVKWQIFLHRWSYILSLNLNIKSNIIFNFQYEIELVTLQNRYMTLTKRERDKCTKIKGVSLFREFEIYDNIITHNKILNFSLV